MSITPITDMVSRMLDAGVGPEIIILAVRTAELSTARPTEPPAESAIERRRRLDRERKASARSAEMSAKSQQNVRGQNAEMSADKCGQNAETYRVLDSKKVIISKRNQGVKKVSKNTTEPGLFPEMSADKGAEMSAKSADKKADKRADTDEDFEKFWKGYPRTPTMSKKETRTAWDKLTEVDREAVLIAGPKYAAWLASARQRRPDEPALHAVRFITQRRFEGFNEAPEPPDPGLAPAGEPLFRHGDRAGPSAGRLEGYIYLKADTPEWDAWKRYSKSRGLKSAPTDKFGGWLFPTKAPPG